MWNVHSSVIIFSMSGLHMPTQEPGMSPADGLVDVVFSSLASADWTVGLLDKILKLCTSELPIF